MYYPIAFPLSSMLSRFTCLLIVCVLFLPPLAAQETDSMPKMSLFDHWYQEDTSILDITVTTSVGDLMKGRDESYQDGKIEVRLPDGTMETWEGEIRLRGNIRREICMIPPMKIKVKKRDLKERGWITHNKLKLVVPCRDNSVSEQYIVREYLTYKLYEHFSDISLRVQMVRLNLIDSEGKKDARQMRAFIIEPIETLAARHDMVQIERDVYRVSFVEKPEYKKMAFFQYMVGNTDWSVPNFHNLYFLGGGGYQRLVAVPYDFDYAGIVGTHYAVPHESLPIKAVTQRLYRGLTCTEEEARALVDEFIEKKDLVLGTVENCPWLDKNGHKEMTSYLEGFFKQLERAKGIIAELSR